MEGARERKQGVLRSLHKGQARESISDRDNKNDQQDAFRFFNKR